MYVCIWCILLLFSYTLVSCWYSRCTLIGKETTVIKMTHLAKLFFLRIALEANLNCKLFFIPLEQRVFSPSEQLQFANWFFKLKAISLLAIKEKELSKLHSFALKFVKRFFFYLFLLMYLTFTTHQHHYHHQRYKYHRRHQHHQHCLWSSNFMNKSAPKLYRSYWQRTLR